MVSGTLCFNFFEAFSSVNLWFIELNIYWSNLIISWIVFQFLFFFKEKIILPLYAQRNIGTHLAYP